jgi:hypothetical protein
LQTLPVPNFAIFEDNREDIPMCDPVLIASILEELGYFHEEKEKDKQEQFMIWLVAKRVQKTAGRKKSNSKVLSIVDLTRFSLFVQ